MEDRLAQMIELSIDGGVATVLLNNPARFNAMSCAMWRELRLVFARLQSEPELRCVILRGAGAHFCAGGDISEYPAFRFDEASLRDFHENIVWGALQAMLDCDLPIVAQVQGNCMGAGVEMVSCCDLRIAGESARFGAPIAHLGFPMAPREAQLVVREAGLATAREMLLCATVLGAGEMRQRGFLQRVLPDAEVEREVQAAAQSIARLAPQAGRMNKQLLRSLAAPRFEDRAGASRSAYDYASSAEHREGIAAFLEKRKPVFLSE